MTCIEKFTFSRHFTGFLAPAGDGGEPAAPRPVHSEDDLVRARAEAHAAGWAEGRAVGLVEGRTEGAATAAAARDARALAVLEALLEQLEQALGERDAVCREAEESALALALTALRKALPTLHRRHGPAEIEALALDLAEGAAETTALTVAVHPDCSAEIEERLNVCAAKRGLGGRLTVTIDPELDDGDCRITWTGGGAERRLSALMTRIEGVIETIASNPGDGQDARNRRSTKDHG
jgi:flagellar assembly protein FliH